MSPLVTVVIPTHNRTALLRRTLDSVLAQRDVDLEVVVVSDGSSSRETAATAALEAVDDRVSVLINPGSLGVAGARNRGIAEARGGWIAFLDDDDLWSDHKLRAQLDAVAQSDARWVYTGAVKFVEGPVVWQVMHPPTAERTLKMLASKCVVPAGASNVLVRTDEVRRIGGFDAGLMHMADWDLWLRLLEQGPPAVAPGLGVGYRLHPHAMSLNPQGILAELGVIDRRWCHLRGGRAIDRGPTHLWIGTSRLRAGERPRAVASFLRAARTRPRQGLRGAVRALHPRPPGPARDPATSAWGTPDLYDAADGRAVTDGLSRALTTGGSPTRSDDGTSS